MTLPTVRCPSCEQEAAAEAMVPTRSKRGVCMACMVAGFVSLLRTKGQPAAAAADDDFCAADVGALRDAPEVDEPGAPLWGSRSW